MGADEGSEHERDRGQSQHGGGAAEALVEVLSQGACRTWQVTELDWLIVAFAAVLALFGFRQGFFVGFAAGAFLGTRLGPLVLSRGSSSPYAPVFGLGGALLGGAILASGLEGIGFRLRRTLRIPGIGVLDGLLGAIFGAVLGLGIIWIVAAVAAQTPGQTQLRADIQRSSILQALNEVLPPSGPILDALARLDPLPSITGPAPDVSAPLPGVGRLTDVREASRSVVRVLGTACGLAIEGSGWVAEPDIVVTNAHVVAGETDTTVQVGGVGPQLDAEPIFYDPDHDLTILRVHGLDLPSLRLAAAAESGTSGAILGYPENGPFDVQPGRIGRTQTVLTQNAYGEGPVSRLLTPLRGLVRPGNSGGPLVADDGRVLTTVFAATVGGAVRGGYGVANATVAEELAHIDPVRSAEVGTEACTAG
jgi:S1-C subfamily serine protease